MSFTYLLQRNQMDCGPTCLYMVCRHYGCQFSVEKLWGIPSDSGFMAKVILPEGLRTNYRKQRYYQEGFTAQAEIITEDLKLSDRLFNELNSSQ